MYTTLPPIVHFFHDRPWKAPTSLGLRAGASITGLFTGIMGGGCHDYHNAQGDERDGCADAMKVYLGFLAVGTIADAATLGWDASPRKPEPRESSSIPVPAVAVTKNGGSVHLAGTF